MNTEQIDRLDQIIRRDLRESIKSIEWTQMKRAIQCEVITDDGVTVVTAFPKLDALDDADPLNDPVWISNTLINVRGSIESQRYHRKKKNDPHRLAVIEAMSNVMGQLNGETILPEIDPIYIPIGEYKPISRQEITDMSRDELEEVAYDLGKSLEAYIAQFKKMTQ